MKLLVIEYDDGSGYNCKTIPDSDCVLHVSDGLWASRRPFNRVEMQNRINRFLKDNPGGIVRQDLVHSPLFETGGGRGSDF